MLVPFIPSPLSFQESKGLSVVTSLVSELKWIYYASKLLVGDVYRILFPYISASLVSLDYT